MLAKDGAAFDEDENRLSWTGPAFIEAGRADAGCEPEGFDFATFGDTDSPDVGDNEGVKLGASGLSLFGLLELAAVGIATGAVAELFRSCFCNAGGSAEAELLCARDDPGEGPPLLVLAFAGGSVFRSEIRFLRLASAPPLYFLSAASMAASRAVRGTEGFVWIERGLVDNSGDVTESAAREAPSPTLTGVGFRERDG